MKSIPRPDRPVRQSLRKVRWNLIYEKYKEFTMMPRRDYIANLELVWEYRKVQGCVVECGVWRGGMSAGMVDVLGGDRDHFLVDSFEGLPPVKEIDGEAASKWQKDTKSPVFFDNCAAGPEWATKAMDKAKPKSFKLVRGWFEKTLPTLQLDKPIAVLRIDADLYDSTMVCLDRLFDRVAPGGIIIIDDYYTRMWDGCSLAVHDFLSRRRALEKVRQGGLYLAYLEKIGDNGAPKANEGSAHKH